MDPNEIEKMESESQQWHQEYLRWGRNHKIYGFSAAALSFTSAYNFESLPVTEPFAWAEVLIGLLAGLVALGMTFFDPSNKAGLFRDVHNKAITAIGQNKIGDLNDSGLLKAFHDARAKLPTIQ